MLIDQAESSNDPEGDPTFPSPVAGTPTNDSTPTSADVHLYCDPNTYSRERPLLYADCEGLNAGERVPMGAHIKRSARLDPSSMLGIRAHTLEWAKSDQTKTRKYAVASIYPRLLYTFSDVVVFVLKEPKYVRYLRLRLFTDKAELSRILSYPLSWNGLLPRWRLVRIKEVFRM